MFKSVRTMVAWGGLIPGASLVLISATAFAQGGNSGSVRGTTGEVAPALASAGAVRTVAYDNVHVRVPDPAAAAAWYVEHLSATKGPSPTNAVLGKTLIAFVRAEKAQPSAGSVIDHIAVSYPDVNARLKSLEGSGATIVKAAGDAAGPFASRFIEDPWGVRIELLQDPGSTGFHHVHLRVADPAATLKWYHDAFGGERGKLNGRVDGVRFGQVWLFADQSREAPAPSAERAIQNVAWEVVNVDEAATVLKARGVKAVIEPRSIGPIRYAFFEDPNGVRVELLQRPH